MIERKTYIPFGVTTDNSIDFLLGTIEDARATTLQRVFDLSIEELHWQYAEGWNTIGCLLAHIISAGHFFRIYFVEGRELTEKEKELHIPGLEMGKYIPQLITNEPLESYLKKLEEARTRLEEEILKLDTDQFFKKREGYNPKTGFNLAWALYHLAEDEVHHRGQISILRKLFKIEKPS